MSGNEASAIGSLRAINSGQAVCTRAVHPARMQLLSRTSCWPPSGGQGFISPDLNLTHVIKSGYYVDLEDDGGQAFTGTVCNASTPESVHYAKAEPVTHNSSGTRSFATDVRGTIFQTGTATRRQADRLDRNAGSVTPYVHSC